MVSEEVSPSISPAPLSSEGMLTTFIADRVCTPDSFRTALYTAPKEPRPIIFSAFHSGHTPLNMFSMPILLCLSLMLTYIDYITKFHALQYRFPGIRRFMKIM